MHSLVDSCTSPVETATTMVVRAMMAVGGIKDKLMWRLEGDLI